MRRAWHCTSVGDLSERNALVFSDGYRTRGDQLSEDGLPILRVADVGDGTVTPSYKDHVAEDYRPKMGVKTSRPDDVLVTTKGTVGRVARVPGDLPEHVYSPQLCFFRVRDPEEIDPAWLYSWARSPEFAEQAAMRMHQTDMAPYLSLTDLRTFRLTLPPLAEQRAIAGVLGSLDDLIDTNQRLVADLARQVELVFEARFAGLDPARTPDLPVRSFASSVRILGGGTPNTKTADYWGGSIPWYSVVDAPHAGQPWCIDTQKKITDAGLGKSSTRLLPVGTTILSARGTVGTTALTGVPMAMNQSCYGLRSVEGSDAFTYCSTRAIVERLRQMAHGSVFSTITRDTLETIKVIHPSHDEIKSFDEAASPLLNAARALAFEGSDLRRTRDVLLPLLMSGAVSVREVVADAAV